MEVTHERSSRTADSRTDSRERTRNPKSSERERPNTLSSGARLPTEILIVMFELVYGACRPVWTSSDRNARLGWVVLSHVCCRWRAILLDMPLIWSRIGFAPKGWTKEFFKRSLNGSGLLVAIGPGRAERDKHLQQQVIKEVVLNFGRIKTLEILGAQVYEFLEEAKYTAPSLRILELDPDELECKDAINPNYMMPSHILAGQLPNLLSLSLTNLPIDTRSPLLSANLVELKLDRRERDSHPCSPRFLPLTVLIEILRRMPLLVEFTMQDVLTEPPVTLPADLAQIPPVELHHLKTLCFHSPWPENYRWFMRRLNYQPSLPAINMGATCSFMDMAAGHNNGVPLIPFAIMNSVHEIEISAGQSPDSFTISGWRMNASREQFAPEIFSVTIKPVGSLAPAAQGIEVFVTEYRQSLLETAVTWMCFSWNGLRKDSPRPRPSAPIDWAPSLRMLPSLACITASHKASGYDCKDLVNALAAVKEPVVPPQRIVPCPNLLRLEFPLSSVRIADMAWANSSTPSRMLCNCATVTDAASIAKLGH